MRISDWSSDVCCSDLGRNPLAVEAAGIEFDRQFGMMRLEAEQQLLEQADEIDQRQAVGTAAAKGDAPHPAASVQPGGEGRDFPLQRFDIGGETLDPVGRRSEEHTSELQSLMRISYAVFCLKKKTKA